MVYAGSGHEVKTLIVAGKVLVRDGEVLTADEAAIRTEAQMQAEEVARRVASDPVHRSMAPLEALVASLARLACSERVSRKAPAREIPDRGLYQA